MAEFQNDTEWLTWLEVHDIQTMPQPLEKVADIVEQPSSENRGKNGPWLTIGRAVLRGLEGAGNMNIMFMLSPYIFQRKER